MAFNDLLEHIKVQVIPKNIPPPPRKQYMLETYPKRNILHSKSIPCLISGDFSVISYNILADCYVHKAGYWYCKDLTVNHRHESLVKELISIGFATIMCFQEVTLNYFSAVLEPTLQEYGYKGVFQQKSRIHPKAELSLDGLAVFYKHELCVLVRTEPVILNDELNEKWQLLQNGNLPSNWYRDTVALLCTFNINGKFLALCNVHIHWDYTKQLLQALQGCLVYRKLVEFSQKYSAGAQLYCGDFNSQPHFELYRKLTTTGSASIETKKILLDSDLKVSVQTPSSFFNKILPPVTNPSHEQKSFFQIFEEFYVIPNTICSAYKDILGYEPKFTNYTQCFHGCLDYIFYNQNGLCPVSILELPQESDLMSETALPNTVFQSDHISLKAEFKFTPIAKEKFAVASTQSINEDITNN